MSKPDGLVVTVSVGLLAKPVCEQTIAAPVPVAGGGGRDRHRVWFRSVCFSKDVEVLLVSGVCGGVNNNLYQRQWKGGRSVVVDR